MNKKELSIEEMIGQRFIFGVNNPNVACVIKLIKECRIGGVILYRKNYENYSDMLSVIKKMKEANKDNKIPLFISIDQEGGRVNRIPSQIHNLRNINDVSRADSDLVANYADIIGRILYESGINMNFAPVMDIDNHSKSNVLFKRCFYGDDEEVYQMGKIYVDKLRENKVMAVIKHFPGHGISKRDSHFFIPYISNTEELFNKHIVPFNKMIKSNAPAIMIGHLIIRGETKMLPASISTNFINKYLCDKNYHNLIITDEVNMLKKHLLYRYSFINKAIKSPSDIILVKIKDYNEGVNIISKYKKMLDENSELIDKLEDNVKKIITYKEQYSINDNTNFEGVKIDKINQEIDKLNAKIGGV